MSADDEDLRTEVDQAKAMIDSVEAVALDVVQAHAWDQIDGAVTGAIRIPPQEIGQRFSELPPELGVITYCT